MTWNDSGLPFDEMTLSACNTTATWRVSVPLPDCPHPVDQQKITADGVECKACGKVQSPHTDDELEGIER